MSSKPAGKKTNRRVHHKSVEKRQRILDAAARALAENGYIEAKLSEIAREAGTHAGSLYYYFPSRDDLMKEVLLAAVDRMAELSDAPGADHAGLSPLDRIQALVRAAIDQLTQMKSDFYLRAYLRNYDQVPENIRTRLKDRRRKLRRTLTRLVGEAQASGQIPPHIDRTLATQFIAGATNWVGLWYRPDGHTSAEQLTETFLDLMLHGLQGAQPAPTGSRRARKPGGGAGTRSRRPR